MSFMYNRYNLTRFLKKEKIKYSPSEIPRMFIYQLPHYGNIGDQAIAYAMIEFLKNNYKSYQIIENRINYPEFQNVNNLRETDKICLVGGGNFGDLYPYEMWYRNYIIKSHPNTEVIIFPVSIFYQNNKNILADCKFYQNENIKLMVRELNSYQFAKQQLSCQILLVPDIVNYFKYSRDIQRANNKICLLKRNDIENKVSVDDITNHLDKLGLEYIQQDNHCDYRIENSKQMKKVVNDQLANLSSYDLIITDRLHGMIFAYITNTPAIILPANIKVKESYELWYKDVDTIHYVDSFNEINVSLIDKLKNQNNEKQLYDEATINTILDFIR